MVDGSLMFKNTSIWLMEKDDKDGVSLSKLNLIAVWIAMTLLRSS
jgi:hypothetical protein